MIAPWILYTIAVSSLLAGAALVLERIARLMRWPTRGIWLATVLGSVLLPALADGFAHPAPSQLGTGAASGTTGPHISFDALLLVLWVIASLVMMIRLVVTTRRLRRHRRNWRSGQVDGTPVLLTREIGPALVGLMHPRPVVPAWTLELDAREQRLILLHETEHARASDPWLSVAGVVSTILTPWNPALWWSVRRLRLAVEMDCDTRVLRSGVDARSYASLLLAVGERAARTQFAWEIALAGSQSLLERRILAMTAPSSPRRPRLAIAGLGVAAILTLLLACEAPVPDQVLPGPAASTREPPAQRQLGAEVPTTVVVNGVPTTQMKLIYRIYRVDPGQGEHANAERKAQPGDTGAIMLPGDRVYLYYTTNNAARGRDHTPERP